MIGTRWLRVFCLLPLVGYGFLVVAPVIGAIGGWAILGAIVVLGAAVLPLARAYRFDRIAPSVVVGGLVGVAYLLAQDGVWAISPGSFTALVGLTAGTILASPFVTAAWTFVEEEGIGWQIFSFQLLLVDLLILLVLVASLSSLSTVTGASVLANLKALLVQQFTGIIDLARGSYVASDLPLSQFPQPAIIPLAALGLFGTLSPLLRPQTVLGAEIPLTDSTEPRSFSVADELLLARHPEFQPQLRKGLRVYPPPARAFPGATPLLLAGLATVLLTAIGYAAGISVLLALSAGAIGVALVVYVMQRPIRFRTPPLVQASAQPSPRPLTPETSDAP
ncbi:MAG: hypothetical protein WAN87_09410 [Thermoplasmata archaeon]